MSGNYSRGTFQPIISSTHYDDEVGENGGVFTPGACCHKLYQAFSLRRTGTVIQRTPLLMLISGHTSEEGV